jgi:hypothetical protein
MQFRIESTDHANPRPAQTPEELETRLTSALTGWLETTMQESDAKGAELHQEIANVGSSGIGKPEEAAKALKKASDAWRDHVKVQSATLDDVHATIKAMVEAAIPGAVAQVKAIGKPCRVSIVGHVDADDDGASTRARPRLRIETHVDLAKH